MKKPYILGVLFLLVTALILVVSNQASAEQNGGSPESGSTSRIKQLETDLSTLTYGQTSDSPDWGATWNRIKTAAKWTPNGNAVTSEVKSGKTFFANNRTIQTGTYPAPSSCPNQQYHDSYGVPATQITNCTSDIAWVVPSPQVTGDDKQDPRTGLVWSQALRNLSNVVTFSPTINSDWSWDGTTDPDSIAVGNKTAKQLCSERGNGWRLPTQKELMQAYIDGSFFNLTLPSYYHWSATEYSAANAWYVGLYIGGTYNYTKTTSYAVRCVR